MHGHRQARLMIMYILCCPTSVCIHMFKWFQRSGHFTLVCAVVSQLRGTAVCHSYNYACWKDLTEGEVCLVPLMALKLRALPSFKQTRHKNNDCFQTLFKHSAHLCGQCKCPHPVWSLKQETTETTEMQWGVFSPQLLFSLTSKRCLLN